MTIQEVLDAKTYIVPAGSVGCADCGQDAIVYWPVTTDKREQPYCQRCLDQRHFKLCVAMGIASIQ